jgi:hypothetical protein
VASLRGAYCGVMANVPRWMVDLRGGDDWWESRLWKSGGGRSDWWVGHRKADTATG